MAAPHVSGLIAAFLSKRREFIGRPDDVKRILLENCTDLSRQRNMQGAGDAESGEDAGEHLERLSLPCSRVLCAWSLVPGPSGPCPWSAVDLGPWTTGRTKNLAPRTPGTRAPSIRKAL